MRFLILVLTIVGALTMVQANSGEVLSKAEITVPPSDAGPTTVIISNGRATYFDDGGKCTINLDDGTAYRPDC